MPRWCRCGLGSAQGSGGSISASCSSWRRAASRASISRCENADRIITCLCSIYGSVFLKSDRPSGVSWCSWTRRSPVWVRDITSPAAFNDFRVRETNPLSIEDLATISLEDNSPPSPTSARIRHCGSVIPATLDNIRDACAFSRACTLTMRYVRKLWTPRAALSASPIRYPPGGQNEILDPSNPMA